MDIDSDNDDYVKKISENNSMILLQQNKLASFPAVSTSNSEVNASNYNNMSLFTAVEENNLDMLNMLLHQPNVNLNQKNPSGETALLMSVRMKRSVAFINRLIDAGCDLNATNERGQTALHLAVQNDTIDVAQKLIDKGADLDLYDAYKETVLYYAVWFNNLEWVCMLLFYGADVRLPSKNNQTPLIRAYLDRNVAIITTLIDYYYEFSHVVTENSIVNLLEIFDVNLFESEDYLLLQLSLLNGCAKTFKLVWCRIDHKRLLLIEEPFLIMYANKCSFSLPEWLDCLYLIFQSPWAFDLIKQYSRYTGYYFLINVLESLSEKGIEPDDRIAVIYTCLSIGIKVSLTDINWMFVMYGFKEELEAVIYAGNYCWTKPLYRDSVLLHFLFSLQEDCSTKKIFAYFYKHVLDTEDPSVIIPWFKFFSLSSHMKYELINASYSVDSAEKRNQISENLRDIPEFPSLVELSRNRLQKVIRETHKITKPYQFHDVVKGLCLPKHLKEIVLFKRPIYKELDH